MPLHAEEMTWKDSGKPELTFKLGGQPEYTQNE